MKRIFITIYILLLATLFTIPFGIGHIVHVMFEDETTRVHRDISKGTFALLAEQLEGLESGEQVEKLAALQPKFGYSISLYPISRIQVAERYQQDFNAGLIVEAEKEEMLVMRLGESMTALAMGGPWPDERLHARVTVIFLVLFMIFLTLPALAWSYFLIRDIRKIEKTSARFASGDHGARVRVSKISSMTAIVQAFNTMAEKTQKLIASQKELASSVSHEIRTPLARIKFSLEMASEAGQGRGDYMEEIGRDVEEIESLVDEMLTYARFEREPEHNRPLEQHEMVSFLQGLVDRERKTAPDRVIGFCPDIDHLILRFEPVYLGWAVRNLLRNALRYSRSRVVLGLIQGEGQVAIQVEDDGPGIPGAVAEKIFEPFFRLDQSRSRASGGHGLGLSIARRIAHWHQGDIRVKGSPLGGARFTLILPVDDGSGSGKPGFVKYPA